MTHKLIKTDNYLLVVDDSEIKEGEYFYSIRDLIEVAVINYQSNEHYGKIIAHLPLNNSSILEGVPLLPPLEDEVEKLADALGFYDSTEDNKGNRTTKAFITGYNTAKEKYKYTEEDLVWAIQEAYGHGRDEADDILYHQVEESIRVITKYLQQPKYPVAFECEMEYKDMVGYWYKVDEITKESVNRFDLETRPKTTTNSQGQTVLVGTYKYK